MTLSFKVIRENAHDADPDPGNNATFYILGGDYTIGNVGFRVSVVPEPATLSLLALGGLALIRRRSAQVIRRQRQNETVPLQLGRSEERNLPRSPRSNMEAGI